jgi:hypothetical protein
MSHMYPAFIVGKYKGEYLKYRGQDFMMLATGTRSGKGMSVVIPNLLTYPDSAVVEDIKEENFLYTSGYRRKCGHEVYLWSPFSEDGRSHAYNPLEYVAGRPAYTRVGDVMTIGEFLYPSNVDARLKYWNDNARNLVYRDRAVSARNTVAAVHLRRGAAAGLRQGQVDPGAHLVDHEHTCGRGSCLSRLERSAAAEFRVPGRAEPLPVAIEGSLRQYRVDDDGAAQRVQQPDRRCGEALEMMARVGMDHHIPTG